MKVVLSIFLIFSLFVSTAGAEKYEKEVISELEMLEAYDQLVSNGHWECHCMCFQEDVNTPGIGLDLGTAEIPGKCDSDTEGTGCYGHGEDGSRQGGVLDGCQNVFVIDKQ